MLPLAVLPIDEYLFFSATKGVYWLPMTELIGDWLVEFMYDLSPVIARYAARVLILGLGGASPLSSGSSSAVTIVP